VRNGRAAPAKNGLTSLDSTGPKGKKSPMDDLVAVTAAAATPARLAQAKPAAATGLSGRPVAPPRKTRHMGLILTGILLLFLALVAAWSSIFLASSDDPAQPEAVQTASATPDAQPAPAAAQSAEAAPTAAAPADAQSQNEIFLATMDAAPETPDPSALPDPEARGDSLPLSQAAPPPFGTTYQFDAEGRIKPTPDGVITPEGVTLVAGKPPLMPKPRPAALAAAAIAAVAAPAVDAAVAAVAAETPFPSDPALAGARPRNRPAGLALPQSVAPATTATPNPDDGAALAPATALPTGPRPLARPAALAAVAAPTAPVADASAASLAANLDQTSVSPLAIAISRRPAARPSGLNSAVEAAVAEASRPEARPETPAPEPAVKLAAAPEAAPESNDHSATPEADAEPEAASAAPSIPTRASVAKQATLKNAFDLGKTNLIGVYGTPSKRYALVRTSSGGFKKVKPGDRIDGGKVVSIGDDELRVQKGGRTIVLALPKT
jgi:Tfp pilus assembly protein PilP